MAESTTKLPVSEYPPLGAHAWGDAGKRVFDLAVAIVGLVLLSPLFAWLAWQIKRDSAGPVLYRGPRIGRYGRQFYILKFRTMREEPESYNGPRLTSRDDPRVTPFGRWLRDTKLNELPQLWNVLRGEMSLVGPRPEDPKLAESWPENVRREILSVRPGITSPASVQFRNEESLLKGDQVIQTYMNHIAPSKLRLDQLYVRYRSIWLDVDTILWTLLVLLPTNTIRQPDEDGLLLGPVTRVMRRYVNWFFLDSLVSLLAMGVVGLLWQTIAPLRIDVLLLVMLPLSFALMFSLAAALIGANRVIWAQAPASEAVDLAPAVLFALVAVMLINLAWPGNQGSPPIPTMLLLVSAALAYTGFVAVRYRTRLISGPVSRWVTRSRGLQAGQERALIVGGGESGQFAAWLLRQRHRNSLTVAGFVDDDLYKQEARIHGIKVLGKCSSIPEIVQKHDIGVILFAIHNIAPIEREHILSICRSTHAQVMIVPDVLAGLTRMLDDLDTEPIESANWDSLKGDKQIVQQYLAQIGQAIEAGDLDGVRTKLAELQRLLE